MDEFRKIVELQPVLLEREDLAGLQNVLLGGTFDLEEFSISVTHDSKTISADSSEELLQKDLPERVIELTARFLGWDDSRNIIAGVSLTLHHNFGQFQIHSYDETWFLGKISKIESFFKEHRPWYASIHRLLPPLGGLVFTASLLQGASLIREDAPLTGYLLVSFAIIGFISLGLFASGRLFPHVTVYLQPKGPGIATRENLVLGVEIALLIATILSVLTNLV